MTIILAAALLGCARLSARKQGMRDAVLRGMVWFGIFVVAITEALGALRQIRRGPLLAAWCLVLLVIFWRIAIRGRIRVTFAARPNLNWMMMAGIAAIATITLITALVSPPNSADAMAYHMPRVVYWSQAGSVSFFPTTYFAQVSLPPLAEYFVLHTYVLSGSDRFANLVQWLGSVGCAVGVSLIARLFGAGVRGQLTAALFCATLPNGILQASGAKNDYLLALWLVAMCYFGLRYSQRRKRSDLVAASAALGLALLTKATAYLFAPAMLLGCFVPPRRLLRATPALAAGVLLINAPHYWRNLQFSGSPLGYDSAQGDGFFRWRNETLGWRQTISNLLRHTSEQLGARSPEWNRGVYELVRQGHAWLGQDPNDPATTWRWTTFAPPRNSNHESDAGNRWHLLLLLAVLASFGWKSKEWLGYLLAIGLALVLFCFYLKWQPFLARMFLPLFVLSSPVAGLAMERLRPAVLQLIVCLFLLNNSRPYLFENWVRPWKGANSIWQTPRDRQYFNDLNQFDNRASFEQAVALLEASGCRHVGIDINQFQVEYPFQALLIQRDPAIRFMHSGVDNASSRYTWNPVTKPCAILCMECLDVQSRIDRYGSLGTIHRLGRFLLVFPKE